MQDEVQEEDITKHETPGVEESAVVAVECKVEIKEEYMDTEDPLSDHIPQGKVYACNSYSAYLFIYSSIHLFIYSSIHLFICSSIHLLIYSSVHLFIYSSYFY